MLMLHELTELTIPYMWISSKSMRAASKLDVRKLLKDDLELLTKVFSGAVIILFFQRMAS